MTVMINRSKTLPGASWGCPTIFGRERASNRLFFKAFSDTVQPLTIMKVTNGRDELDVTDMNQSTQDLALPPEKFSGHIAVQEARGHAHLSAVA